jgi:hypothetical protein
MSNTNVPPNNNRRNELLEMQNRLTQDLNRSLIRLRSQFESFVNPVTRLTDSIKKVDKTNIEALRLGTTYQKLTDSLSKNSDILNKNLTSNRELTAAIIDRFGRGVRVQSDALDDLTTEMVATGQDIRSLNRLNSDLVLFTGNNVKSIDTLAKVNQDVSDTYGITNDKLINTLNSLKETMQQASFFGAGTVESLGEVATQLQGRAGGTDITGALNTLNRILIGGLETERTGALLGATQARERAARGGRITLRDVLPILSELESRREQLGGGRFGLDILSQTLGLSKAQTAELLNLAKIAKEDFKIQDEIKKTTNETYNSIENINKRAVNFYDNTAVATLGALGSLNTNLVFLMQQVGMAGGLAGLGGRRRGVGSPQAGNSKFLDFLRSEAIQGRTYPGFSPAAVRQVGGGRALLKRGIGGTALSYALGGMARQLPGAESLGGAITGGQIGAAVGSFIPGLGTLAGGLVGGGIGLLVDLVSLTSEGNKIDKERLELEKQKRREERALKAAQQVEVISFLTTYVRSRMSSDPNATSERYLESIDRNQRMLLARQNQSKTSIKRQ